MTATMNPPGLYPGYYYRADVKGDRFLPPTPRARAGRSTSPSLAPPNDRVDLTGGRTLICLAGGLEPGTGLAVDVT